MDIIVNKTKKIRINSACIHIKLIIKSDNKKWNNLGR